MARVLHHSAKSIRLAFLICEIATEIVMAARPPDVTVEPHGCICPSQNYTCRASSVLRMDWWSDNFSDIISSLNGDAFTGNGVEVRFSAVITDSIRRYRNIASHFQITDIQAINGIELTCYASNFDGCGSNSVTVCVSGPASSPTHLSVMCHSTSAVVSFQPPAYGAECVDSYVVTAINEERVTCHSASDDDLTYNCTIPGDANVNDYIFSVYSVTSGANGILYNGDNSTECCLQVPENVMASEEECGLRLVKVSWKPSSVASVNTMISWYNDKQSNEGIHYENANSEGYHVLTLSYLVTGPLEIAVTFSNLVCNKTSSTQYTAQSVLKSISLSSTTLIIESRDCIGNPENYRIVATFTDTSIELVNIPFSATVRSDVADLTPNTPYYITVTIVETSSNITIDEKNTSITNTSSTCETPSPTIIVNNNCTCDERNTSIIVYTPTPCETPNPTNIVDNKNCTCDDITKTCETPTPTYIIVNDDCTCQYKKTPITYSSTPCETPNPIANDDCTCDQGIQIYVAVGVSGGVLIGVVVGAVITLLGVCLKKNTDTPKRTRATDSRDGSIYAEIPEELSVLNADYQSQAIPTIYDTPSCVLDDTNVLGTLKNSAYGVTESASDHNTKPSH